MRLAYVNILWILFTISGLVVLGLFPATAAMFAVTRKWIMGQTEVPVFNTFWTIYRTEFVKANLLGLLLIAAGYILYLDFMFLAVLTGLFSIFMTIILTSLMILFIVLLLYLFPVYVHYNLKFFQYFKNPLIIGLSNPFITILMIVILAFLYFIMTSVPGLLPFYSGSLLAYGLIILSNIAFRKVKAKKESVELMTATEKSSKNYQFDSSKNDRNAIN